MRKLRAMNGPFVGSLAIVTLVLASACGSENGTGSGGGANTSNVGAGGSNNLGPLDPRCSALCSSNDSSCTAAISDCEPRCQIRVAGMTPLCATCLLDKSDGGTCGSGGPCCPHPSFPNSVVECASSCKGSNGINPASHPVCAHLCASSDSACSMESAACLQQCEARIQGVSGLCALCLLDGANGGTCGSDGPCCPHADFPTAVTACSTVCGN